MRGSQRLLQRRPMRLPLSPHATCDCGCEAPFRGGCGGPDACLECDVQVPCQCCCPCIRFCLCRLCLCPPLPLHHVLLRAGPCPASAGAAAAAALQAELPMGGAGGRRVEEGGLRLGCGSGGGGVTARARRGRGSLQVLGRVSCARYHTGGCGFPRLRLRGAWPRAMFIRMGQPALPSAFCVHRFCRCLPLPLQRLVLASASVVLAAAAALPPWE